MCNALRYFGRSSPNPGTEEWEGLVDLVGCRYGTSLGVEDLAEVLGLRLTVCSWEGVPNCVPVSAAVANPEEIGCSYHSVLIIGVTETHWTLVNYRWYSGPVVEEVPVDEIIKAPIRPSMKPHTIELM
jgi:hypothetical protein